MGLTISAALSPARAGAARPARKQILFFTKSSGYEHSVIKKIGDQPSHAETVLTALAEPRGWAITHTKDGRIFGNPSLAAYDAFFFYTTGDLTAPGTDGTPPERLGPSRRSERAKDSSVLIARPTRSTARRARGSAPPTTRTLTSGCSAPSSSRTVGSSPRR